MSGRAIRWLLLLVFAALLVRLGLLVVSFGTTSVQMDFSAYYAAGQSVRYGLSPYVNHVDHDPPIWDGVNRYRHSRFLYPPLAARLLLPFALLPYAAAKYVWMVLALLAAIGAVGIAARLARLPRTPVNLLVLGIVTVAFFPLLTLLERGQIDSATLLLVLAAAALTTKRRTALAGGALFAVATMLKLHCVFLVPFLLIRRRFKAAAGFVAGAAALLVVGIAVDGYATVAGYIADELPRIARHGEGGSREMLLSPDRFRQVLAGAGPGRTVMDGREYEPETMQFVLNASLVRTPFGRATWSSVKQLGIQILPSQLSLIFFAIGIGVILVGSLAWGMPREADGVFELTFCQIALVLVLLCAPATWAMGAVWLLPVAVLVLYHRGEWSRARYGLPLAICLLGLTLAGVPDALSGALLGLLGARVTQLKYVIAELLVLAGLLALWRADRMRPSADRP